MTNKARTGFVPVLVLVLAGCSEAWVPRPPTAPSPVSQPVPAQVAVFKDPGSDFSTTDVRDIEQQIMRFNTAGELIWAADGTRHPGFLPDATDNSLGRDKYYEIRFMTRNGERRAYFCAHGHDDVFDPPRMCDVEVVNRGLKITETNVSCVVPGM